ncbi:hypothetical protein GCM10011487_42580 [Steroidobacter agaridevorans]|uniref:DUF1592 domain-containing protein n=1 Tax=Steroidobacter agaridevorans TaxID=2695856 RepID=A0A829YHG8_9GAMM|nr:DUF1592 domain-containing protein [Steroidobacter agaridevorans]GFE82258.1 hypothetical protein GCM10011487_42580 [Steroidobacter agaridevorans]
MRRRVRVFAVGVVAVAAIGATAAVGVMNSNREPESKGTPASLRLLTEQQYLNTIMYVFGPNVRPTANFAAVPRVDGLLNSGTALAGITDTQLEIYQKTAGKVAAEIVREESRGYLVPCTPAATDAADPECARSFLAQVGPLLYRRPVPPERLEALVAGANQAADSLKDFYQGLSVAIEGLLLSPSVLLVAEHAEPDPDRPGEQRLNAYSLATRLSLFLWNAAPDAELLKAAGSGELHTRKGLEREVDRMLASPRLETGVRALFDDMFAFEQFATLAKDNLIYPIFSGETAVDAREQTLRTVVDHLVTRRQDYRDLFTSRQTFMSPSLAPIYQVPAPGPGWEPFEFPAGSPRAGLLTQISFLALHSHPGRSSATMRGKALREVFLCQVVPKPPPNVDFSAIQNPDPNIKTARERVNFHLQDPGCAGCHRITDPMGLTMEAFDGSGVFRHAENDAPIDTSGNLDGVEFTDAAGLGEALRDNAQLPWCMVRRAFAYGTGTPSDENDRRVLEYLADEFAEDGYVVPDLLREIALSRAFSKVHPRRERVVHPLPDLKSAQRPSQLTAAAEPVATAPQTLTSR